jgi:methylglutamate dehydrogenase subunit D
VAEASAAWSRRSPWTGVLPAGRRPDDRGTGITIEPRDDLGFAAVVARKGRAEELRKTLFSGHAVEAPVRPALARGRELDLVWNGPERWLAISSDRAIAARLSGELGRLAAICDQSDALAILRIAGPKARAVLAKGCPIDLHPRAFRPGDAALTAIAHVGLHLWQVDEAPTFELAIPSSMAGSFARWLSASMSEFGAKPLEGEKSL